MYELSRIRLYSIGPAGARYADTVLDLRGVGDPVPSPAPAQADFFEDDPAGPPRRPAPAGVLFLENGGGKSVLLKLIFSVMLPGHRNTLGGASSGVLRKFLLADDCGHVALEWQHTRTGETVVVGKVSEWRGRQVSGDPRKFAEAWYSFRPGPGLALDSLPVAESAALRPTAEGTSGARGRRRTMKGFRDALTEIGKAYPGLDVVWEEVHERWNERLTGLGLDPELFRYQREMNADEGEAAGLFAVKNDSDFTDLLLRAVTDTRDTDGLADLVHGFAHKLGRRAELTAERDFTAGSLESLDRIAELTVRRERARDTHAAAEARTRTLARRLAARGGDEHARAAALGSRAADAERAVARAEDSRARSSLVAAELAYRHASLALAAAEKGAAAQRRELTDARTLHSAWQAAETVLQHRAAADRVARVSAAIQAAERDAAPALAARARAATALVRALEAAAERGERMAAEEEERSSALQVESDAAHREATAAATEVERARGESGYLRQRLTEVEQETAEAVRAGWIAGGGDGAGGGGGVAGDGGAEPDPGPEPAPGAAPDPARAALAASEADTTATAAWEDARDAARRTAERAQETAAEESRVELAAARASDAAESAESAHLTERRAAEALGAEERLAALLGLPSEGEAPARGYDADGSTVESLESTESAEPNESAGPSDDERSAAPAEEGSVRAGEGPLTAEELDRNTEALTGLLEASVAASERQLFELRTAAAEDSRMLGALGDGGLLPPGCDVTATVDLLGEHGIPALPGWRYLAQAVDPADHADVLAARPELVDGVVITDPGSHARARDVLAEATLLPRSAVAVGTAAALVAPTPASTSAPPLGSPPAPDDGQDDGTGKAHGSAVFLVPPNPAMHDESAADEERSRLRERVHARDEEIRALAARLSADRSLTARLASWRTGCPPGRLAELAAERDRLRDVALAARQRHTEARTDREEADEAAAEAARLRDERQEESQRARRAADALAGLAHRLRERAGWQARLSELSDEAAEAEERAAARLTRARAADEDRRAAQRAADDAHRTARALRAERADIAGAPETSAASDTPGASADDPDAPDNSDTPDASNEASLPTLREAYRSASQLYEKVGVGADLRAEQAHAESDESAARAALDRLTNKVRTRAARLLEGPDGADGPSRQAAAVRAESQVEMLESRASSASEELGRLRGEAERLAPADGRAHTELAQDSRPADTEEAQTLLRSANAELTADVEAWESARRSHEELAQEHRAAEEAEEAFEETATMLRDLLRDPHSAVAADADETDAGPEPYAASAAEARRSAAEARRSLRGCAADLSAAEQAVREACDVLVPHANSGRYEQVRTPARQQIRELPASALPEHAAAWAEAFRPRLRVLTDELEQLERNRDSIVDRLRGLVESSLATLRSAQRLSRLPEGLGEWSGQEFLRIRFDDPDQATLTERLGEVIDEATRAAVRKNSDLRRDGMTLLLRGVHAALQPHGVRVEILKPDAVLRAERVPVGQMGDVFSGGQLLTAAIALYCTMAALRSNDRGRERHQHAGTLFLDNPIGRANATYLLELQRAVADALGVQLLYTTGLFDTTALAEFPLVVRLRNDADLRAGLKYISVEEHLRPGLPRSEPGDADVRGEITATRTYVRPEGRGEEAGQHP